MTILRESWAGAANGTAPLKWTALAGSDLTVNVQSGALLLATSAALASAGSIVWTKMGRAGCNGEVAGQVTFPTATSCQLYVCLGASLTNAPPYGEFPGGYGLFFDPKNGNSGVRNMNAGAGFAIAATAFTWASGTPYRFRFRRVGANLAYKIWDAATAEPSAWTTGTGELFTTHTDCYVGIGFANSVAAVRTASLDWLTYNDLAGRQA